VGQTKQQATVPLENESVALGIRFAPSEVQVIDKICDQQGQRRSAHIRKLINDPMQRALVFARAAIPTK